MKRAGIEPIARILQSCRQAAETDRARSCPQHAVSAWLGHSVAVSLKHYLTVTEDLLNAAAGLPAGAAESAAEGSGTEPQGAETVESDTHVSQADKPTKQGFSSKKRNAPSRTRTCDRRIRNPKSCNATVGSNPYGGKDLRESPESSPEPQATKQATPEIVKEWLAACPVPLSPCQHRTVRDAVDRSGA